jgi:transcriptional antiterminator Rof (Rho-off)
MSKYKDPYHPISCADYSRYEVSILHQEPLRLAWKDENDQLHLQALFPIDLQTRDKGEFLVARDNSGQSFSIRLDYIINYTNLTEHANP